MEVSGNMIGRGVTIGVIGDSYAEPSVLKISYEVGRRIAEHGGVTIGILSGTSKNHSNQYINIPIVTGLGEAREWSSMYE